jgi:hypothetical protein
VTREHHLLKSLQGFKTASNLLIVVAYTVCSILSRIKDIVRLFLIKLRW